MSKRLTNIPRLMPALMVTLSVLLGLKAVAFAEGVTGGEIAAPGGPSGAAPAASEAGAPAQEGASPSCPAPNFAESAGLSASEVQILQSLGARRTEIDARAKDLDTRSELAAAAEKRIEERVAELKRLEAHIQNLLGQVDEAQEKRIASLVDVYQRMRAKDAAAVFDALENDVLVQVASRMKQQNLAEILGKMDPSRARELTRLLAADNSREAKTIPPGVPGGGAKRS